MTTNNPPPVPLLNNLGKGVSEKKDIEALRNFLYLLWVRLGGGEDRFIESSNLSDYSSPMGPIKAQVYSLSGRIEDIAQLIDLRTETNYDDSEIIGMIESINSQIADTKSMVGLLSRQIADLQQEVQV